MNLFVDAHVFDDLGQGSKTYVKGIYEEAVRADDKRHYFFAAKNTELLSLEFPNKSNVHFLTYASHNKYVRLGFDIPGMIRRNKIDWAHFQYISPVRKTCREIVTIHDLLFLDFRNYFPTSYRFSKNLLFRRSARRADWILTVSEFSKEAIIRHYGIEADRIVVTPNGILDDFWDSKKVDSSLSGTGLDNFILYVSRFEPRKNQSGLLKAFHELGLWKTGGQLVLAGGVGISSQEFDKTFRELPESVKKSVHILTDVPHQDLKWLYQNCRLFVYPSFAEGFGIPPLEALASGANVICSNTTAMAEYKFLGDRLFDPNNFDEMCDKISWYWNQGKSGDFRDVLRQRYTWSVGASRVQALLV